MGAQSEASRCHCQLASYFGGVRPQQELEWNAVIGSDLALTGCVDGVVLVCNPPTKQPRQGWRLTLSSGR